MGKIKIISSKVRNKTRVSTLLIAKAKGNKGNNKRDSNRKESNFQMT
jgi:hypothetical protein